MGWWYYCWIIFSKVFIIRLLTVPILYKTTINQLKMKLIEPELTEFRQKIQEYQKSGKVTESRSVMEKQKIIMHKHKISSNTN